MQTFIITTWNGMEWDVDTIISGPEAAHFAWKHREMLKDDCGFTSKELRLIMIEGVRQGECCCAIEDKLQEGKPFGRKAMARFSEEFDCRVSVPVFQNTRVTAK